MEHVVFFPAQDGSPAFRRLDSLEEAVRLVEDLRNVEGVAEASVHALTEVPLSFRAYYRVEVPGLSAAGPGEAPDAVPAVPVVPDVQDVQVPRQLESVAEPEPESARSLGFFA